MKLIALALGLALPCWAAAGEHPKEHPTPAAEGQAKGDEHPKGHEHPKDHEHPVDSKEFNKQISQEYTRTVQTHVGAAGGFSVKDEALKRDWSLKLLKVHKDKVVPLGGNRFFACADFKAAGKGEKDKLDLDFYASRDEKGKWTVLDIFIHKLNGKERYTYNEKNERVYSLGPIRKE